MGEARLERQEELQQRIQLQKADERKVILERNTMS
jgi:hypothetical protein